MPTRDELLAAKARKQAMQGAQATPALPMDLENELAGQAQAQALNPQPVEIPQAPAANKGVDRNSILNAQFTKKKPAAKASKDKKAADEYMGVDLTKGFPPLTYAKQWNDETGTVQSAGDVLAKLEDIKNKINVLRTASEGDFIDPDNTYIGGPANMVKDAYARFTGDKEEMLARKDLESALQQFQIEVERGLKGGVLGEKMYKRLGELGTLPELSQGLDVVERKLNTLGDHAQEMQEAATISLETGRAVPANKLHLFRKKLEKESEKAIKPVVEEIVKDVNSMEDQAIADYDKQFPQFKNAPRDAKIEFLKSKGLLNEQ